MICPSNCGYNIIRSDRLEGRGGGVAIVYKSSLNIVQYIPKLEETSTTPKCFEYISADFFLKTKKTRISCFYLPPCNSSSLEVIKNVCRFVAECTKTEFSYLLGDFNLPNIYWNIPSTAGGSNNEYFLNFCLDNFLIQHILLPTHVNGNTLDLFLCNNSSSTLINTFSISAPFCTSCDHFSIEAILNTSSMQLQSNMHPRPNFKKANYNAIYSYLFAIDWTYLISSCSDNLQLLYDYLIQILLDAIECFVP